MSTAMIEPKAAKETILFSVTEATVMPMVEKYLALKIDGVDDKTGLAAVRAARQDVRKARVTVDKEREAAKRFYLEEGRKIDGAAKSLWALIDPVEEYLVSELERIDAENQRIADEKLDRRLEGRQRLVNDVGGVPETVAAQYPSSEIRVMTDERFKLFVEEMSSLNGRLAAEARERAEAEERNRLEALKLAEERAELDRLRKAEAERQAAEQKRLDEERRVEDERIAAERAEEKRLADEERKRLMAERLIESQRLEAERAEHQRIAEDQFKKNEAVRLANQREADRIDAERQNLADEQAAKEARERAEVEQRQQAEAAEAKRIEDEKARAALLPHKEKIAAYRDALLAVPVPMLPDELTDASEAVSSIRYSIEDGFARLLDRMTPESEEPPELDPGDYRCAEASQFSAERYIPCSAPAVHFIKNRDQLPIPMCLGCSSHNVKNRGGKIVDPKADEKIADIQFIKGKFQ